MWGDAATMTAGATGGHDVFAFGRRNGHDVIEDFRQGEDQIDLSKLGTRFDQLEVTTSDVDGDGALDSVIKLSGANSVTVLGVSSLSQNDFVF
jgi:hypothetical protein